jgi:hypothetical protein
MQRRGRLAVIAMQSPLDITNPGALLTFEAFRRATSGLPPATQLGAFLRLPPERQAQAWSSLRTRLDAGDDIASAA